MRGSVTGVHVDAGRGHIAITDRQGTAVTLSDVGPVLDMQSYRGVTLSPSDAIALASALSEWATGDDL